MRKSVLLDIKHCNKMYLIIMFALILCLFSLNQLDAKAGTKDSKKPTVTLNISNEDATNQPVTITIVAKDKSGIKIAKWANGDKKESYFKNKGTIVTLSNQSAKISVNKNSIYTFYVVDKASNITIKKIKIANIDCTKPNILLSSEILNQTAKINVQVSDDSNQTISLKYLKGDAIDSKSVEWENATDITNQTSFTVTESGIYSIMATDKAGNSVIEEIKISFEFHAMFISYLEFSSKGYTESAFKSHINTMFDQCVNLHMNAVVVQIRPCADSFYPSNYFPWSKYVSGTQGKDPGYDPLQYMIEAAHSRGLQFHAWLNPYRVTMSSTNYSTLSEDNKAREWYEDNEDSNDRNVLAFNNQLFFNPASIEAQNLIIDGIKEIVSNYDVDGICFDDYFYPSLGNKYKSVFDSKEYNEYLTHCKEYNIVPLDIINWRRDNVSSLVHNVYQSIKSIKPNVRFGISPHGNIDNLTNSQKYYVDINKWLSTTGYVDYIAPQIYWTFSNKICPFEKTVNRWLSICKEPSIDVYVSVAVYLAGSNADTEWQNSQDELKRQIETCRDTGRISGFMFYRYASFFETVTQPEVTNLLSILSQ